MPKVAITLVATLMMLGVPWLANSANIEGTTDGGKRVLLNDDGTWKYIKSKQGKANEVLANAAVKVLQAHARLSGRKISVPAVGCYKSAFLKFVNRDPKTLSKHKRKNLEMMTVGNFDRMIELLKEDNVKNRMKSLFKKKRDVLTKDEEILGLSLAVGFIGIRDCAKLNK